MYANPVCSGHRKKQQKIEFSRILYVTDDDKFSVKGPKNTSQGERNLNGPAYCKFARKKYNACF